MKPQFEFKETRGLIPNGRAVYRSVDLALDCRHDVSLKGGGVTDFADSLERTFGIQSNPETVVVAGTCALTFVGPTDELISLDAYTNRMLWIEVSGNPAPTAARCCQVVLVKAGTPDRLVLDVEPSYSFDRQRDLLRIGFASEFPATAYCRVSTCLVIGLNGGDLAVAYVEGVETQP